MKFAKTRPSAINWDSRIFPFYAGMLCMLSIAASSGGCGRTSIERAAISGKVTLDGQPLPRGQIRFIPTGENQGPSWSAWIKDGEYTTQGTKGVPVGDLRVEIKAFRIPVGYVAVATANEDEVPREQYLPAKFNTNSELTFSVSSGAGSVEKNWELSLK
jgi:hypothetical protein